LSKPVQREANAVYCDYAILIDLGETEVLIDGGEKSPGVVDYLKKYVDGPLEVIFA
jgi:hypothetical protein